MLGQEMRQAVMQESKEAMEMTMDYDERPAFLSIFDVYMISRWVVREQDGRTEKVAPDPAEAFVPSINDAKKWKLPRTRFPQGQKHRRPSLGFLVAYLST